MANLYQRTLVLHADDLGMNPAVNAGILCGFFHGLLTSTSVLANGPSLVEALSGWRTLQADYRAGSLSSFECRQTLEDEPQPFDLGVHLNLTQGRPLTAAYPEELRDSQGRFPGIFGLSRQLWLTGRRHQAAIRAELHEQLARVRDLGVTATHVNGHQYVEMLPVVSEVLPGLMARFGISICRLAKERPSPLPLTPWHWPQWSLAAVKRHFAVEFGRRLARAEILHGDGFRGASHAGRIDDAVLARFIKGTHCGLTEIALHPGETPDPHHVQSDGWTDPLASLRPRELDVLTSPRLPALLHREHVRLGRLADLRTADVSVTQAVA
jgi:predicted glycoside hydrolase/deacetylase ChbG (UPF0249 family)